MWHAFMALPPPTPFTGTLEGRDAHGWSIESVGVYSSFLIRSGWMSRVMKRANISYEYASGVNRILVHAIACQRFPVSLATYAALALFTVASPPCDLRAQALDADLTNGSIAGRLEIGETFTYDLTIGPFKVGRALMHVAGIDTIRDVPTVHVVSAVKGGILGFGVHDRMDSWIGLADFAPRRFIQDLHEGVKYRYLAWDIHPDSGYSRRLGEDSVTPMPPNPLDNESFMYLLRGMDLEVGERYEIDRYFRPDKNPIVVEVLQRDTIDVPAGQFPALVVHPVLNARGYLTEGKRAQVWLSDDHRRLVVQIKIHTRFGPLLMRLKSAEDPPLPELLERPSAGKRGR
jgi:hypothetical protein